MPPRPDRPLIVALALLPVAATAGEAYDRSQTTQPADPSATPRQPVASPPVQASPADRSVTGASSLSFAQPDGALSPWDRPARDRWTFSVDPQAWYVGLSGNLTLPGTVSPNQAETRFADLDLDNPRLSPLLELRFRSGPWSLAAEGTFFETLNRERTFAAGGAIGGVQIFPGETISSDATFALAAARVGYRLFQYVDGTTSDGRDKFLGTFDAYVGARAYFVDIEAEVQPTSPSRTGSEFISTATHRWFAQPVIGGRLEFVYLEQFHFDLEADLGYFEDGDSSASGSGIAVGFAYEFLPGSALEIGYRNQFFQLIDESGDGRFEWEGGAAGLTFGVRLLF